MPRLASSRPFRCWRCGIAAFVSQGEEGANQYVLKLSELQITRLTEHHNVEEQDVDTGIDGIETDLVRVDRLKDRHFKEHVALSERPIDDDPIPRV